MVKEHGIIVTESPTSAAVPREGTAGLQVVFGTAPVNMAADPEAVVNQPIIAYTYDDAVAQLGYSSNYKYTLCESMDASFKLFNVAPVIFVNVLDTTKHKKTVQDKTLDLVNKQGVIKEEGILLKTLVVKDAENILKADIDFTATFESTTGYVVIVATTEGKAADLSSVTVSYDMLDPDMVTEEEIIGGYNVETGKETGIELIRSIYPKFNLVPGLILAPGWSHNPSVGAVLQAKCEQINGMFRCNCILDLDTSKAPKYTDVIKAKEDSGFVDEDAVVLWPMVKAGTKIMHYSAVYAAMTAYTDAGNDDVPSLSPSNKLMNINGICLENGTEINIDQQQANSVNGDGVVTAVNMNGWKSWGNNTAAYPSQTDGKDIWIGVRRMFSWQANSFVLNYISKVDDPANYRLIESIVDSENVRCNAYTPDKWAGARIEYRAADNPLSSVLNGKMKFKQYIAPYIPAEVIINDLEYDTDMLMAAISGGEA